MICPIITEIKASIEQANQAQALKSYIDAQDNLKEKESQAYADGKISEERATLYKILS